MRLSTQVMFPTLILGVHFNFSFPLDFWPKYKVAVDCWFNFSHRFQEFLKDDTPDLQDFISASYLGVIRNFFRYSCFAALLLRSSSLLLPILVFSRGSSSLLYLSLKHRVRVTHTELHTHTHTHTHTLNKQLGS